MLFHFEVNKKLTKINLFFKNILGILLLIALTACSSKQEAFMLTEKDTETPALPDAPTGHYLIITGSTANHVVVAKYDLESATLVGTYLTDFRSEGDTPRGMAGFDDQSFLVTGEGSDSIYKIGLDGTKSIFHVSSNLTGNLYDITAGPFGLFYIIETNNIEVLDTAGARASSSVIATTTGACTLNTPRMLDVTANNELLVVNTGGTGPLLFYNVSTTTPTCIRSVAIGNTPVGLLAHSNGKIYIGTQTNDRIVQLDSDGTNMTTIWDTNTSIISDPSVIKELPNGDLLVASSATSTIEQITTSGVRVGSIPLIRDSFSLTITDMIIVSKANGNEL